VRDKQNLTIAVHSITLLIIWEPKEQTAWWA